MKHGSIRGCLVALALAAAMGLSSVFVLTNALRLKAFRPPRSGTEQAAPARLPRAQREALTPAE